MMAMFAHPRQRFSFQPILHIFDDFIFDAVAICCYIEDIPMIAVIDHPAGNTLITGIAAAGSAKDRFGEIHGDLCSFLAGLPFENIGMKNAVVFDGIQQS